MVSRGDNTIVVWPRYFDASLPCKSGRRVAKNLAVRRPQLSDLQAAAKSLGLTFDVEDRARDPAAPHLIVGRLLIQKSGPKTKLLQDLAAKLHA